MRHLASNLALVASITLLPGCVVTGTLDPMGGGRLTVIMRLVSVKHFEEVKAGLQSDQVKLTKATMTPRKWALFEIESPDVRKLSTAPVLSHVNVRLASESNGTQNLAVTFNNPAPQRFSDATERYFGSDFRIVLDLPGDVIQSNATSVSGRKVTWIYPFRQLSVADRADMSTTFAAAAPPLSGDVPGQ